ncbi:MAG TPA: amidohydrolase family protein [Bryobacteraceae bacterium]|nr:amidohydrolase family protein [Bryobacteraceae bacterium]
MRNALIAVLFGCAPLLAAAGSSVLLRGGTVHPVSGPVIQNASVLIRDGKIAEVGARVAAPKGVRIIDIKGLHIYPGLIDSSTSIGLSEIGSVRETVDTTEIGDFNPQVRAMVAVNPASEHIAVTRANGTTTVISAPAGALVAGQAALLHLDGWTWQEMAVKPAAGMVLNFPNIQTRSGRGGGMYGGAPAQPFAEAKKEYEKRVQGLHEFFENARRYQQAKAAGAPGFETDLRFEAMLPVLEGRLPVIVRAARERAIRDALKFAEEEKFRMILAGAPEAYKVAADLKAKGIPVICGPTLELPMETDDPYDRSLTIPAELYKAGVKIAFGSFDTAFARNLPYQAANAVAYGLPYDEALKALTLNAAEIWGVTDQIGSIDKGKSADLIVTDGDPLETRTQVKYSFIAGKQVDLTNKHTRLYEKHMARE